MANVKPSTKKSPMRPGLTPEAREGQLISLAVDCAEQQLRDGTASSQIIVHYLKLATERERLEREKIRKENKLLDAKAEVLESQKHMEATYVDAIKAMRRYSGHGDSDDEY